MRHIQQHSRLAHLCWLYLHDQTSHSVPSTSGSIASEPLPQVLQLWRDAQAVCFDVDSTLYDDCFFVVDCCMCTSCRHTCILPYVCITHCTLHHAPGIHSHCSASHTQEHPLYAHLVRTLSVHRCEDESIDEIAAFLGVGEQVAALTARYKTMLMMMMALCACVLVVYTLVLYR